MRYSALASCLLVIPLVLNLLAVPVPKPEPPQPAPNIVAVEGVWSCKGRAGEDEYTGVVRITRYGDVYRVGWLFEHGAVLGTGIRDGDVLIVGWTAGMMTGTARYEISRKAGKPWMQGRWASLPGNGKVNEETLEYLGNR